MTATVDYASIGVRKRAVGSLDAVTATVDPPANYGFIVDLGHSNPNQSLREFWFMKHPEHLKKRNKKY